MALSSNHGTVVKILGRVGSTPEHESILEPLLGQIRAIFLDQFRILSSLPKCKIDLVESADLAYAEQMTHILLSGNGVDLNLKTHFMISDILALSKVRLSDASAKKRYSIDYMKEFSNVVAGKTKGMLEKSGLHFGESLPFAMRGYNEIFYPDESAPTARAAWKVGGGTIVIRCSASIVLRSRDIIDRLQTVHYDCEFGTEPSQVERF